jgi:predicted murein hydrolase (TIGR00659 family)
MAGLAEIWVYLAREPLAALTATLLAWLAAGMLAARARWHPAANPVLIAVLILAGGLLALGVDYAAYFAGAQFVHFLLGPATVALAVPLYRQWLEVRQSALAASASVVCGGCFATLSGVGIAIGLDAAPAVTASLAPRSVTTPVAMGVAEKIGGIPSLTAVMVVLTGMVGAVLGSFVFNALRVKSYVARGFAIGLAAHGQGVARAFIVNAEAGAFAGLAMGLTALATALLAPWLAPWLLQWLR